MGFAICGTGWQGLCPSWVTGHIPVVQQEPMGAGGSSHNGLHKDWKVILKYQNSCCILFVFENNENKVMFNNTVKTTRRTLKIPYVQNESHYVSWQLCVFLSDWWTHKKGRIPPQKIILQLLHMHINSNVHFFIISLDCNAVTHRHEKYKETWSQACNQATKDDQSALLFIHSSIHSSFFFFKSETRSC